MVKDENGFLALPMSLILIALWIGLVGTVILMKAWKHQVNTQLRLDRCVARSCLRLKATLNKIEAINLQIETTRAAILVASVRPEAAAALKSALHAEALAQDELLLYWKSEQAAWIVRRGCDGFNDIPKPIPQLSYERPPPDPIGELPLYWGSKHEKLKIHLQTAHRSAAAEIKRIPNEKTWQTRFTAP